MGDIIRNRQVWKNEGGGGRTSMSKKRPAISQQEKKEDQGGKQNLEEGLGGVDCRGECGLFFSKNCEKKRSQGN